MPELCFEGHVYQVDDLDTVLNTLLKNGHAIPNFCRGGYCHSCMMRAEEGTPLPFSQMGLDSELVKENYFLTCQCAVYAPLKIARPDKDKRTRFVAMVREKKWLSSDVIEITLAPDYDFVYKSGQYTTLINIDGIGCDYPIASNHGTDTLMSFHIDNNKDEPLSQYIINELEVNDGLEIMTALGELYYCDKYKEKEVEITAVDLGLSCAYGFVKMALANDATLKISVSYKGTRIATCYLQEQFLELMSQFENLKFFGSEKQRASTEPDCNNNILKIIFDEFTE